MVVRPCMAPIRVATASGVRFLYDASSGWQEVDLIMRELVCWR